MFSDWEDFALRFGPFGFVSGPERMVKYRRTDTAHILRIRIDREVKKQDLKARLVEPGVLEIEWPRSKEEDIPIG